MIHSPSSSCIGVRVDELRTPAFIVDLDKLRANTERMLRQVAHLGVGFRPHMKTAKSIEAASYMLATMPKEKGRITVSTLEEARYFSSAGYNDILYGIPIVTSKLDEVCRISKTITRLALFVDNIDHITLLLNYKKNYPEKAPSKWSVYLKVDCGNNRAGVMHDDPESVTLAATIANTHKDDFDFMGIYAHSGHSYRSRNSSELVAAAREEIDLASAFARKLKDEAGIHCRYVSIGSTPACAHIVSAAKTRPDGIGLVNEIHPGNYVFYDLMQAELGSCSYDDIAVSVACKVVGHYPKRNQLLVDAGALALTSDRGCIHLAQQGSKTSEGVPQPYMVGFGCLVSDINLRVVGITQELGKIEPANGEALDFSKYPIGCTVSIYPNHSCLTAAMFEEYHIVNRDGIVTEKWRPCKGW
eukprot:TRINITY_DN21114_c0_g1_i1.p1 TRINITY_DN21114_c0_g1~~TRINITY_DN21114_c0_g1_i1.p1  ORF type:complete len:429 (+),score=65.80 TRINITY_DN21114_c0_g1_i1:44-1288(+)